MLIWPWKWGQCHQNLIISFPVPIMCRCKFGRNPPDGSEDADMKLRGRRRRRDPHQKRYASSPSVGGHNERPVSGSRCLELGLVDKPCLERGRCLNCVWNKVYMLEIYVLTTTPVSLTSIPHGSAPPPTPGLRHWHGLGELESKTHIKLYVFFSNRLAFSYKLYFTAYI